MGWNWVKCDSFKFYATFTVLILVSGRLNNLNRSFHQSYAAQSFCKLAWSNCPQVHCNLRKWWRCSDLGESGWWWSKVYHCRGEGLLSGTEGWIFSDFSTDVIIIRWHSASYKWCLDQCVLCSTEWQAGNGELQQHRADPHISWRRSRRHLDPLHHQCHTRRLQQHWLESCSWVQVLDSWLACAELKWYKWKRDKSNTLDIWRSIN